jgi:hypothetical protein
MDTKEARAIADNILAQYRTKLYSELAAMVGMKKLSGETVGISGTTYQYEVMAFWDDSRHRNVRVWCAIDDGGWRAFRPLINDFIITPDGTFIGE